MKKALLCVGNELRGDDGVAISLGREIEQLCPDWQVFYGFDTPESEIYAIRDYEPDFLLIADAAVGGFGAEFMQNEAGVAFNTHTLPLHILKRYLDEFCPKILFLALFIKAENFSTISTTLSSDAKNTLKIALEKFNELNEILNQQN
ncbi:hydrogenase maturation protease [Campylobacter gastrosuis]|uniref:Hydrogenase maturation protease n=1 Tax=Campylobacter gastrosuis TaxID=2974576 RepID=A0ABT7HQ26_9BACT|nr:hydrogenase maturation protease [Campylobacter gastrosuis]MDL0089021.1 hydrogenase maturation protease [Campylobacter gastrosuis]